MNILGIGIDVVEVGRIKDSIKSFGSRFLDRIFTEKEQVYCEGKKDKELNYAARFAAKEAISKAFGTGLGESMRWTELEITRLDSGQPIVVLHGGALAYAEKLNVVSIQISLTHTASYAAANAIITVRG